MVLCEKGEPGKRLGDAGSSLDRSPVLNGPHQAAYRSGCDRAEQAVPLPRVPVFRCISGGAGQHGTRIIGYAPSLLSSRPIGAVKTLLALA